jgi:hypothetical protein
LTPRGTDVAVFQLFGHMHKRGLEFTIDLVDIDEDTGEDERVTRIYRTTDWDNAPVTDYPYPYLAVSGDQRLRWSCTHQNGRRGDPNFPPKVCGAGCSACGWQSHAHCVLGDEVAEQGASIAGPDGPVTCEPDCVACGWVENGHCHFRQGQFYEPGDPMPLVFGELADDDMCNMFGYFVKQSDLRNIRP